MFNLVRAILFFSLTVISVVSFAAASVEGIQVYQKNLTLSPEHKQKLADDIYRYRNADNLWDVLRDEFTLPHYEDSPLVQEKIQWFLNNQDFLLRSATRAAPYLYYISQQVKKRHLPAEIVLLPIIESGYNPYSLSNVGAAGIWQLMPGTASGLGIKRDFWYDGRRDVIASTHAALNYLAYLQSFFEGNWLLALAAYNTGEGNVLSAIRRNIRDGRETDFWSLPVAQQTKDYVPSLLALAIIISNPHRYPIYFPPVRNAPYLAQIDVDTQINLKTAASFAGLSYKKLLQLNPGFNRPNLSRRPYKLVLPIENVEAFTENLAQSPLTPPINWLHYKMKSGDTLISVAHKFNTSVASLKKLNHLGKSPLRRGTNLLIPTPEAQTELAEETKPKVTQVRERGFVVASDTREVAKSDTINLAEASPRYELKPGDTIYMVRKMDTWNRIANRFHISTKSLQAANPIGNKALKPGKHLIIPTHIAESTDETISSRKKQNIAPGDTLYMIRRGDTIQKIATKFRTSADAIRLVNLIDDSSIQEGDKIIIPAHLRS